MRTTIDRAGRIVVPKAIRLRLALSGGETLEIEEHGGRIEIRRPESGDALMETESGLLAFADGPGLDAETVRGLLESTRR